MQPTCKKHLSKYESVRVISNNNDEKNSKKHNKFLDWVTLVGSNCEKNGVAYTYSISGQKCKHWRPSKL